MPNPACISPQKRMPFLRRIAAPSKIDNPTASHRLEGIKELMLLEQERQESIAHLEKITNRVNSLQIRLLRSVRSIPGTAHEHKQKEPSKKQHPQGRMKRGELRDRLVDALIEAGPSGVSVKALSAQLDIKPANLHSWFHSSLKRYSHIQKTAPGRYLLEPEGILAPLAKRMRGQQLQGKVTRQRMRSKKGEVARKILSLLKEAGEKGLSVSSIAEQINSHYRNIHVWFSSTGKKNPLLEKIGRGVYRLNSPAQTQAGGF